MDRTPASATQASSVTTFLFTDIEGSTRLWEAHPDRMRAELARHDAILRDAVETHRGTVVKTTGDGMYAAFSDPIDAVNATLELQRALAQSRASDVPLHVRCGLHAGVVEHRDRDFFGTAVNRAQRIMTAAHGGQVLLSQVVADLVRTGLPGEITLHDLGPVRLRDIATPEHLYQLMHPELRRDFPVLRSLATIPTNLPQEVTSFVGRQRDVVDVLRMLRRTRLLTLHGVGGIGKTRLSLQVARAALEDFPDGTWFVDLAGSSDPSLVVQTLASVLGVKEPSDRPLFDAIAKRARECRMLIVLDNCEHLVQACAALARDLLQATTDVKIITSSREPLHIPGEVTYAVPTLPLPREDASADVQKLGEYASVQLFVERASAVRSEFRLTGENVQSVAAICRRLDGIPLAIELAAARVRALSAEQILARLDRRFALLTSTDRTALPRQQTLRALINWSYELLSAPERTVLARLSVFAAGWTLEAAEAVAAGGEVDSSQVLELLSSLVDKSLVVHELDADRYRLLEIVQQFAHEALLGSGEEQHTRDAHLTYYLALAQQARRELVGAQQRAWLERLDAERSNLLAAHAWCDRAQDGAELGLKLVTATRRYWMFSGLLALGHRVAAEALARTGAQARTRARCEALFDIGQIGSWMGRYSQAKQHLEESLAIARELSDKRRIAVVLQPLAQACLGLNDVAGAITHLTAALQLARELGEPREIAGSMIALAQVHRIENQLPDAERLYADALRVGRDIDDAQVIALASINLAMVAVTQGRNAAAATLLADALAIAKQSGMRSVGQSVLDVCAGLASACGDWDAAATFYGAAEEQARHTGLQRDPTDEAFLRPLVRQAQERCAEFVSAVASGRALDYDAALAKVNDWLGRRRS